MSDCLICNQVQSAQQAELCHQDHMTTWKIPTKLLEPLTFNLMGFGNIVTNLVYTLHL